MATGIWFANPLSLSKGIACMEYSNFFNVSTIVLLTASLS
jgi:hypothetical protein